MPQVLDVILPGAGHGRTHRFGLYPGTELLAEPIGTDPALLVLGCPNLWKRL